MIQFFALIEGARDVSDTRRDMTQKTGLHKNSSRPRVCKKNWKVITYCQATEKWSLKLCVKVHTYDPSTEEVEEDQV